MATLGEVARLFLKLGFTAFGGPAAHTALMEEECVRRRRWLTHEEFLDLMGATNLIPGPNSTELAIHIGHRVAGWAGLVVAGACFIVPAALVVGVLAFVYARFGRLPQVASVLWAVKPVVIAVVAQALAQLSKKAVKTWTLAALGGLAIVVYALGVDELVVVFGVGALAALVVRDPADPANTSRAEHADVIVPPAPPVVAAAAATGAATKAGLLPLFLSFAKIGSVLFGSGYVLLAFLRAEFVERFGWLTEQQLLDAIAVGQVTPGPVFTTATFVGYVVAGPWGAVVATLGIFLPAFVFVAISGPLVPRMRRSKLAGRFLDGVNVASLALMAVVSVRLARSALVDWWTLGLLVVSVLALWRWKSSSAWLIAGAAAVGVARSFFALT
jgi:chromate transporter